MKLPDISNADKMAQIGRLYTLRGARRKAAQQLRDLIVPVLNNIEQERGVWDLSGINDLIEIINAATKAINEIEGEG